jgi:molybdopterin-guanine dinucleotide biosynthesis protein A
VKGEGLEAIVLAGGSSRRFGGDKARALLAGKPLLSWVVEAVARSCARIIVVTAPGRSPPATPTAVPLVVVEDRAPGQGPLAGLVRGLEATRAELCFAIGCDAPLLPAAIPAGLAAFAGAADAVVPRVAGRLQPLVAVYRRRSCLPVLEKALASGERSLHRTLTSLHVRELAEADLQGLDPHLDAFRNANDRAALAALAGLLESRLRRDEPELT